MGRHGDFGLGALRQGAMLAMAGFLLMLSLAAIGEGTRHLSQERGEAPRTQLVGVGG